MEGGLRMLPVCVLKFFLAGCIDDVCVHVHACMYGVYTLLRYSEATRRLSEVEADNGILMRQLQAFMPEVAVLHVKSSPLIDKIYSQPTELPW